MKRTIMLVAGEASGDLHGAGLIRAMAEKDPFLFFCGIGGDQMRRAGMRPIADSTGLAVMGITDVLASLPRIRKVYKTASIILASLRPDLLILIDYPGFNLRLAREARKLGIPVLYYISPKVWAWRSSRVQQIADTVDKLALIFPFEVAWFQERGVDQAVYVGNPLMDQAPEFREMRSDTVVETQPIIGLLPGSRPGEIQRMLPVLCQAADRISKKIPGARFVLSAAPGTQLSDMQAFAAAAGAPSRMDVVNGAHPVLEVADVVAAVSGTVTLEAALAGVPTVLVYRMSAFSYAVAKRVVKVPYAGLANLIAGSEIMPELLQEEATAEKVCDTVCGLLLDRERRMRHHYALGEVRAALGEPGVAERTAALALSMLGDR
ncbi:lipid-A-disaccharide synthase [Desulfobotulus sp.]|jgi:lipid-A-disaccharide synthase|uniref:lipid-A-disaccharide synthase n=1 Tax=Desulfobotulus sp. TaxID=1940337 RepID=UPI002A3609B6|nr:lipid-A-disaccharide synthase [Desulfobotulus sp.]MDY0162934.1 lipid-A-disaccharide synthase [Desulfobotulus sp.]